ncbi:anion permease [Desulfovibrio sp. OttesenSCG-928-C14]|nr:anion permease [Desulfovibrio sp. OttesenSCG-928-C14]
MHRQLFQIFLGPALGILIMLLPPPAGLEPVGMRALGCTVWITAWWMCDLFSLSGTALLALVIYSVFGVASPIELFKSFGSPMIMIMIGATLIIGAWTESRFIYRYAYWCMNLSFVKNRPLRFLVVFGLACGLASIVIPNIPLAILFTALAVATAEGLELKPGQSNLIRILCMVAGMAACYGGIGTPLGGAPNLITIGYIQKFAGYEVEFWQWTMIGLPAALVCLFCLFVLAILIFPFKGKEKDSLPVPKAYIEQKLQELGPVSRYEHIAMAVMGLALFLWIFGPSIAKWSGIAALRPILSVGGVAFIVGVLLFIIPRGFDQESGKLVFAMNWEQAQRNIGWSIIIMLLGGLVIGDALLKGGVDTWLAGLIRDLLGDVSGAWVWFFTVLATALLSQVGNNLAVQALFTPIIINLGYIFGFNPIAAAISVGMVANVGVMFPFSSTPIAASIVGAKGYASMRDYTLLGFFICLTGAVVVFLFAYLLGPVAFPDVPARAAAL